LRTFGVDLPYVIHEINTFCTGAHPMYPDVYMDGTHAGSRDRRVHLPHATGEWMRDAGGVHLAYVGCENESVTMAHGDDAWCAIEGLIQAGHLTLALKDDWSYWAQRGEDDHAGKMMLVERGGAVDEAHHIFFGEIVESIVDVKDRNNVDVPFADALDRWIVRAEPLRAIMDKNWFVDAVARCEDNLDTWNRMLK